jgi:hypothetical protein
MPSPISLQKLEDILTAYRSLGWYERWISTTPDSDLALSFIQLIKDIKDRTTPSPTKEAVNTSASLNDEELFRFISLALKAHQLVRSPEGKANSRANQLYNDIIDLLDIEFLSVLQRLNQYQLINPSIVNHLYNLTRNESNSSFRYAQRVMSHVNDLIELFAHFERLNPASVYWIIQSCKEYISQKDKLGFESTLRQKQEIEDRYTGLNKTILNLPCMPNGWSVVFKECQNIAFMTIAFKELSSHLDHCTSEILKALSKAQNPVGFAQSIKTMIIRQGPGIDPAWLVHAVNPEGACYGLFRILELPNIDSVMIEYVKSKLVLMKEPMGFMEDILFLFRRKPDLFNKKIVDLLHSSHTMLNPKNGLLDFFANKQPNDPDQALLNDVSVEFLAKYEFSENSFKLLKLLGESCLTKERVQMLCTTKLNLTTTLQVFELINRRLILDSDLINLLLTTPFSTKAVNQVQRLMASVNPDKESLMRLIKETQCSQTIKTTLRVQFLGQPSEPDPQKARSNSFKTPSSH